MEKELSREKVLETMGVLALACLIFGHLARHKPHLGPGLLAAAVLLLAIGLFVKPAARWIAVGWLKFAAVLGAVNSRILLGAIFYLFLFPIAFLARLSKGDFLHLKKRTGDARTYWQPRDHTYVANDIEKPW